MNVLLKNDSFPRGWSLKPADTGLPFSFRSSPPLQHKKNLIQSTVHRIFNAASSWKLFEEELSKANKTWEQNQHAPQFCSPNARWCLTRLKSQTLELEWRRGDNGNNRKTTPFLIQSGGDARYEVVKMSCWDHSDLYDCKIWNAITVHEVKDPDETREKKCLAQ